MYPQFALIICCCKQDEYALGRVQREVEGVLLVDFGVDVWGIKVDVDYILVRYDLCAHYAICFFDLHLFLSMIEDKEAAMGLFYTGVVFYCLLFQ